MMAQPLMNSSIQTRTYRKDAPMNPRKAEIKTKFQSITLPLLADEDNTDTYYSPILDTLSMIQLSNALLAIVTAFAKTASDMSEQKAKA